MITGKVVAMVLPALGPWVLASALLAPACGNDECGGSGDDHCEGGIQMRCEPRYSDSHSAYGNPYEWFGLPCPEGQACVELHTSTWGDTLECATEDPSLPSCATDQEGEPLPAACPKDSCVASTVPNGYGGSDAIWGTPTCARACAAGVAHYVVTACTPRPEEDVVPVAVPEVVE